MPEIAPVTQPKAKPPFPNFPCPKCGEDLLSAGFYNSCSETQRLREDNYPLLVGDKLYLEHNEDNYETIDHQCDVEAFCTSCGSLLPWALYQIRRELDGVSLSEAVAAVAKLLSQLEDDTTPIATA